MRWLKAIPILVAPLFVFGSSCRNESTGLLRAEGTGDLSRPVAERAPVHAELEGQCGTPAATARGERELRRLPYLQSTTPHETSLLWTALLIAPMTVEITTPAGEPAGTIEASRDPAGDSGGAVQWRARVSDLEPDTIYCYAVVDADTGEPLFGRAGLRTAPAPASTRPVRFAVLGDSGEGSADQRALTRQVASVPFDLLLHVGDMAYDSGTFEEFESHFFQVYEDLLVSSPVFPVPGNHEYWTDDAAPFRGVFELPHNERWYSFDWGNVHFVGLDTEKAEDEAQLSWLKRDLATNSRDWTVAFLHMSPYSSGSHGSEMSVRDAFEPIFQKHAVDLVISGHDHHYERVEPQGGVSYLVTGGGGAATYPFEPGEITAFGEEVIHFVYVEVDGGELVAHAIDGSGREFDQLFLTKGPSVQP